MYGNALTGNIVTSSLFFKFSQNIVPCFGNRRYFFQSNRKVSYCFFSIYAMLNVLLLHLVCLLREQCEIKLEFLSKLYKRRCMFVPQKKKFEVGENETIDECLQRMQQEGYQPVRRIEKPLFKQKNKNDEPEYYKQQIIFEGIKHEHYKNK